MIKKLLSTQLRLNMVSGVATTVINTITMAVGFPIYLHFLSYEKYGIWLVLATVLTFAQLGNFGIGPAVMKLTAEEYGSGNIGGIQKYITTALVLLCLIGAITLILILVLRSQIVAAFKLSGENAKMVSWLLPYIGVLSIYIFIVQVFEAVLSGLGRMDLTNYIQSLGRFVGVAVATLLLSVGFGVKSLLFSNIFSNLLIHIAYLICIWRIVRIHFLQVRSFDTLHCSRLLHFGGPVFGSSLINMLCSPFNKLMLSRYAGVSTVPIYEIVYSGSMQVRSLFEVALRALMPEVSQMAANMTRQARNRISQLNSQAMKIIFIVGVPLYVALLIFSPLLLRLWLGERFMKALPGAFRIMLIATFLTLVNVPAYYTIMGLGKVRYIMIATCIGAGGNFILVTAYCILVGHLSVWSIGLCMAVSFAASTAYLICKARYLRGIE